jgi:radical SAM-linked protein
MIDTKPTRIRLIYTKSGNLRFIGHLDLQSLWERAFRRADLPMQFSQGFSPKVRLNLASALPLGIISNCEVIDFWLVRPTPLEEIHQALAGALPAELQILSLEFVPLSMPSLQSSLQASEYLVIFGDEVKTDQLQARVNEFMSATEIIRIRRSKPYDLRALTQTLEVVTDTPQLQMFMRLDSREGATGRPDEVIAQLGFDPLSFQIKRIKLIF